MLGITLIVPVLGMGVFSGIFSIAALLKSTISLAVADVPVFYSPNKQYYQTDSNNSLTIILRIWVWLSWLKGSSLIAAW